MSCKKYIAAILLCSVLLAGCSGFFRAGNGCMGERNPGIRRKQHGGQAVQVVPKRFASIGCCGTKCAPADGRIFFHGARRRRRPVCWRE